MDIGGLSIIALVNKNTHEKHTLLLIAQKRIRELEIPQTIGIINLKDTIYGRVQ